MLFYLLILLVPTYTFAAAPLCSQILSERDLAREKEIEYFQTVLHLKKWNQKELDLAIDLATQNNLSIEKLLYRYANLQTLFSAEVKIAATPIELLKLSATSLKHHIEVAKVQTYMETLLLQTRAYQKFSNGRFYRYQMPHRILLSLAELAISNRMSPGEAAFYFNKNAANSKSFAEHNVSQTPLDRAFQRTRGEILGLE